MKTEKNILFVFLLNLGFSIFEFFGGIFTNSVAILSCYKYRNFLFFEKKK